MSENIPTYYTPKSNGLSAAELERLAILGEECGEVTQAIGKIIRHGLESKHPTKPHQQSNRHRLEMEIGDILAAVELLRETGTLDLDNIQRAKAQKLVRVRQWLHHT